MNAAGPDLSGRITPDSQQRALAELGTIEPVFRVVLDRYGPPPLWRREEGFPTLVRIILEQQVSLASARAAFERLTEAAAGLTPERFLCFDDQELKRIGFSRQKTAYVRHLAAAVQSGRLRLDELGSRPDEAVRSELVSVRGIGAWTANIYLLMALQRPDVWPCGDIALAGSYQQLKGLPHRPKSAEMTAISRSWRPWRSVAARLLWHYYLSQRATRAAQFI